MNRLIQCLLGVYVAVVLADPHQHRFSASHNDILSGLTWATLDLAHLGQRGHLTSLEGLNLTLPDPHNTTVTPLRRRTRSLARGNADNPVTIDLEVRYKFPLFPVYESDFIQFEVPLSRELELPQLLLLGKSKTERRIWDETVGTMLSDLEALVSMLGVDGSGCVRKALCEVAAMPSIVPEGLVGEMLQIFVKHLAQDGVGADLDTNDIMDEDGDLDAMDTADEVSKTLDEEEEHNEEETETQPPEMERQKDGSRKDKETGEDEADEPEEKRGKQKDSQKRKTGKERSNRRRPRKIDEYVAAGVHGKQQGDCWTAFPECPLSLLTMNYT